MLLEQVLHRQNLPAATRFVNRFEWPSLESGVGNSAKSVLMVGLRGVGKTVLLEQMRLDAERNGVHTVRIEAPENRSLPALLAPQLRLALLRLSHVAAAKSLQRGLRALAGFAKALRFQVRRSRSRAGLGARGRPHGQWRSRRGSEFASRTGRHSGEERKHGCRSLH